MDSLKIKTRNYFLLFFPAFCIALLLGEYRGDKWEENIRSLYYRQIKHTDVPVSYKVIVDSNGIPMVNYTVCNNIDAGEQYLPTTISIYARDYYQEYKRTNDPAIRKNFFNCIHWLANHLTYYNDVAFYEFNWQQPFYPSVGVPWRSGLSSGMAIDAFTDAYELTKSEEYLRYIKVLLRGFYRPIQQGGFTYLERNGWWYEEYADTNLKTPKVLNGHIYALLGVYKYWRLSGDVAAETIFNKGLEALEADLSKYDADGGWSYYDILKKKSDKQYQKVVVDLMKQLWEITGKETYYNYYKKWEAPLEEYYSIRMVKEKNRSAFILMLLITLSLWSLFSGIYAALRE